MFGKEKYQILNLLGKKMKFSAFGHVPAPLDL